MKTLCSAFLLACALIVSARADLTVTLQPSVQNSARGRELVFSGTLTNTSATDKLYLNDIALVLDSGPSSEFVFDANSFFSNVPGVLLPGETYASSELFRVALKSTAPAVDYRGTVTLRGGANIFASETLGTNAFAVLSPAVDMQATDASASEFGPDAGAISISRSGGTDIALTVLFSAAGSAVLGFDYEALPSPAITIPAGSSSANVSVVPLPNNIAQGDRTAQLTLAANTACNLGASTNAGVIIHDKPADAWRFQEFGPNANDPEAADAGDWDRDGILNLVEFTLDLDPKSASTTGLPVAFKAGEYLSFSFAPNPAAIDVALLVEGSPDLLNWNTSNAELQSAGSVLIYRYVLPISQTQRGFLRLRVQRTDL